MVQDRLPIGNEALARAIAIINIQIYIASKTLFIPHSSSVSFTIWAEEYVILMFVARHRAFLAIGNYSN